jgi:hypothetical protein
MIMFLTTATTATTITAAQVGEILLTSSAIAKSAVSLVNAIKERKGD